MALGSGKAMRDLLRASTISPYITFTWGKVPSLDRYPNLSLDIAAKRFANCAVGARC